MNSFFKNSRNKVIVTNGLILLAPAPDPHLARDTSQGGRRDEAGMEAAHQEEETTAFLMGVEGWLKQRVSDG